MSSAPPRLAIYVDGANLDIASEAAGIHIDYVRLRAFLGGNRQIVLANYYNSKSTDPGERAFYKRVETAGFMLTLGPTKRPNQPQKETDVQIAVDMISGTYCNSFDIALLVSGDGDLAPAVRKMLSMNKLVEVASFDDPARKEFSWSLKSIASRTIDLTKDMSRFKK
jgi:uncharacterized LabA/DUF88 family protein